MSQPPSPFTRSYSFTAWTVSNPNDPQRGNYIDQQFDYAATSINDTIDRLNEIQANDGKIRSSALPSALTNTSAFVTSINNNSGYSSGNFNSNFYPKEIIITVNGVSYAMPARII